MTRTRDLPTDAQQRLRWPLGLTYFGLFAERVVRAFWPLWTVLLFVLAALFLGLHETMPLEAVWVSGCFAVLGLIVAQMLMKHFPDLPEGELAPRFNALVRREALAEIADARAQFPEVDVFAKSVEASEWGIIRGRGSS